MIQRDQITPMYQQIANYLTQQIMEGIYKEQDRIPTEVDLMKKFDVSRTTVRLAIEQLIKKGLVEKKSGKGTFVTRSKYYHPLKEFKSLYDTLLESNIVAQTELVDFKTKYAGGKILQLLELSSCDKILEVSRLYHVDEQPIVYAQVSVHPRYSGAISLDEAKLHPIYQILENKFNFQVKQAHMEIFAEKAGPVVSKHLNIEKNDTVLGMERVLYTEHHEPIEHTIAYFHADAYRFTISLPSVDKSHNYRMNQFKFTVKQEIEKR